MSRIKEIILFMIRQYLFRYGYKLVHTNISGVEPLKLWIDDTHFMMIWNKVCHNTMIDITRAYMLYQFLFNVSNIEGAVAEVGVWRGGTGQLMSMVLSHKKIYLFDTFEGLPTISPRFDENYHSQGEFSDTSFEDVKNLFSQQNNVQVVKGIFPTSIDDTIHAKEFCFVHIDVDLYQSARDCCEYFYPLLARGGVMIFDDYGFGTCPGVRHAVDEFFKDKKGHFYIPTGQYAVIKTLE